MTLLPGGMCILSTPPRMAAASFDRKGFHTLYSVWAAGVRAAGVRAPRRSKEIISEV